MKKKVIIVNSHNIFGGTIVLSTLCKLLRERGIDARIFYVYDFPHLGENMRKYWHKWFIFSVKYHILSILYRLFKGSRFVQTARFNLFHYIPVKGTKEQYLPFFSKKNTIVVYPEVVYGNFLHAKNVVRWLLYHYKWPNDINAYSKDDLFICYREIFNDWHLNPKGNKVCINYFDSDTYRQYNFGERDENCYIIRKGAKRTDLPMTFDGPIIDRLKETEIVEIFNNHKYCYCYDTQTFYARIAAICGCIPIIMLEPGKTKNDYRSKEERYTPGIAWGNTPEEIEHAVNTRNELLEQLDFTSRNRKGIDDFLEIIGERFGSVY